MLKNFKKNYFLPFLFALLFIKCDVLVGQNVKQPTLLPSKVQNGLSNWIRNGTKTTTAEIEQETAFSKHIVDVVKLQRKLDGYDIHQNERDIRLPHFDGSMRTYKVVESSILDVSFALIRPDIRTYTIQDVENPSWVGRISLSNFGLHGILLFEGKTMFWDPIDRFNPTDAYVTYLGEHPFDIQLPDDKEHEQEYCGTETENDSQNKANTTVNNDTDWLQTYTNGATVRTYDFAVVCTGEFTAGNGGTASSAQTAIVNSVNDLQAIYENDIAVRFNLLTPIVFTNAVTDPFTPDNTGGNSRATQAADIVGANFAASTYDIGHVLHHSTSGDNWSGGGVAGLGVVCKDSPGFSSAQPRKGAGWSGSYSNVGQSWTGLFAHEVAHMFNAPHTFNGSGSSCSTNIWSTTSYEIGSGTTIMSYNGICNSTQNIPASGASDNYFHAHSLERMINYINSQTCESSLVTGNTPPVADANPNNATYTIPISTPFTLEGSATDEDGDALTYCWEQYDEDGSGTPTQGFIGATAGASSIAPLFRSYPPTSSPERTFPELGFILNNANVDDFEALPSVARTINFRLTARDNNINGGGVHCDAVSVAVEGSAGPFEVTSQNASSSLTADGSNTFNVTWNVANTTNAPVSCANVDILLSVDGGQTFPYTLANNVANDGTESLLVPNYPTPQGRIKIVCSDNIFFDINNENITISSSCAAEASVLDATTAMTATAGDAALDLSTSPVFGTALTSISGNISATDFPSNLSFENVSGNCQGPSNSNRYDSYEFYVGTTGSYTFSKTSGSYILNLYEDSRLVCK